MSDLIPEPEPPEIAKDTPAPHECGAEIFDIDDIGLPFEVVRDE